jgi:hypothetical protein
MNLHERCLSGLVLRFHREHARDHRSASAVSPERQSASAAGDRIDRALGPFELGVVGLSERHGL